MLITANQPFGEWGKIFPDQAMTLAAIDRLVHHATILEMNVESYRRREALDRKRARGRPPTPAPIKETEKAEDGLTLRVNQSLAKTAAGVNYPSARLPRLIQIVAPFSSRLSRDTKDEPVNVLLERIRK